MKNGFIGRLAVCLCLAGAILAGRAAAVERRPLPPLPLVRADAIAVDRPAPAAQAQWLLVYVTPGNPACNRLLAALVNWRDPALLARVVVVVGGRLDAAASYAEQAQITAGDGAYTWYADPTGGAAAALSINAAPALVGIQNGIVDWSLSGVLNDPSALESVIRKWVAY